MNLSTKSDMVKYLGILIEPNIKFDRHINEIISRANQRAAFYHEALYLAIFMNLIRAQRIYVRPILEYSSPV